MKTNKRIISVLLALMLLLSVLPFGASSAFAFNPANYNTKITEIHIGAPITGTDGKKYLPVDVHFTANEDLGDKNAVAFLEGTVKATLANGDKAEGVKGLGMTLTATEPAGLKPENSNQYGWSWNEGSGMGILKYNVPLLENGETQAIEYSSATGQNEVNGLMVGDSVTMQMETVMDSSIPSELLPAEGLFSNMATVTIEDSSNYPKTVKVSGEEPCSHEKWYWDYNANGHWKVCSKCEQKLSEPEKHNMSISVLIGCEECHYGAAEDIIDRANIKDIPDQTYTGKKVEPVPVVTFEDKDASGNTKEVEVPKEYYTVTYENNVNVGVAKVIVTGVKGKSTGKKTKEFRIVNKKVRIPKRKRVKYNGKKQTLSAGEGYTLSGVTSGTDAGDYKATATLKAGYIWSDGTKTPKTVLLSIGRRENPLTAKGRTVKVSAKKLRKKKKITVKRSKAIAVSNVVGDLVFKKLKGNKKITVANNGKITVKKSLKKGKYKVKIKVIDSGDRNYESGVRIVTVVVRVK